MLTETIKMALKIARVTFSLQKINIVENKVLLPLTT